MKKRRFRFNFVEILLSLGVAAIGIVALLGVLPIAVKASSEAVADTYAADAADMCFAVLDGRMKNCPEAWYGPGGDIPFETVRTNVTGSITPFESVSGETVSIPGSLRTHGEDDKATGSDIYEVQDYKHFMYVVRNGDNVEFAADICVWAQKTDLGFTLVNKSGEVDSVDVNNDDTLSADKKTQYIRVFAEVSWPTAATEYDKRSKRVYVKEYFRPSSL